MARNGFDIRHVSKVGCLMQLHVFPSRTTFLHGHCVEACPYAYISDVPSCRVLSICRQPHLPNELSAYTALRFHGFPEPRYNRGGCRKWSARGRWWVDFWISCVLRILKVQNCRASYIVELQIHFQEASFAEIIDGTNSCMNPEWMGQWVV